MDKDFSLQQKLNLMMTEQSFEYLNDFCDSTAWQQLTEIERDMLAMIFVRQGEDFLQSGDKQALICFGYASEIAPKTPLVFHAQGMAFFKHQNGNIQCLLKAKQAFEIAINLDPRYYEAWYYKGATLVALGVFYDDPAFFVKADEVYQQCHQVAKEKEGSFFWEWGRAWYFLGKHSGEAVDFKKALEKFKEAAELDLQIAEFWNDYGDATLELGFLVERREMIFDAINFFRSSLKIDPENVHGWFNLGGCFHLLYESNGEEGYLESASESFEKTAELDAENPALWLRWGQLLVSAGKIKRQVEFLEASLDKFAKADTYEPSNSITLSRWGEALMCLGTSTEQFSLLHEARDKIIKSLQQKSDHAEVWNLFGNCLTELGRYFNDEKYYLEAIEKFQYGLTINENDPLLWYGLALAHYAVGDLRDDHEMLEKAVRYCQRMYELGGQIFPQFWNDWGVALMRLAEITDQVSHVEEAIEKFEHALFRFAEVHEIDGINPEWLYNYGCALDFLGDITQEVSMYEKAIQMLSKALDLDPEYTDAHYNLALAYSHLGEAISDVDILQKAVDHFQLMLNYDPEDELAWNDCGLALIHLGSLVYDPSDTEKSKLYYERAEVKLLQAMGLGSIQSFYNLGCVYALLGNYSAAMHYLERAERADALPLLDDLMHDEWLDGLRETYAFRQFLTLISSKNKPS